MKKAVLTVELLEARLTPTAWGNPWSDPENLTLSFAPDGTKVSGINSSLSSEMNGSLPQSTWQREILRAFQTWAQYANINFNVVNDNGLDFGAAAPIQGGRLHGDIRIGAVPLSHGELAVATPFDLLGDWAGDVLFNADYRFNQGGQSGGYDLFTVALQEAGHVLGLPNSPDPSSAMYTDYLGVRSGPSAADIANLQALYGVRRADPFDAAASNHSPSSASALGFIADADQLRGGSPTQGAPPWVALGDLTTAGDVDYYRVQLPSGSNDFWVELRTSGVGLLNARVTVLNAALQAVQSAAATNPQQGNVALFVSNAMPNGTYYIKVEGAQANAFGVGAYRLAAGKETHEALFPATPSYLNDDRPDDDDREFEPLVPLAGRSDVVGPRWDAAHQASISFPNDLDRYQVVAPASPANTTTTMVVTVWALEVGKLDPKVLVYESGPTPRLLPTQTLRNESGIATVQVLGVNPGAAYEIQVEAADPQSSYKEGNYFLGVDFVATPIPVAAFGQGSLTQDARQRGHQLELTETRLFHFVLSAESSSAVESGVRLTIYNASRQVVLTLATRAGASVSADVLLVPGTYTVRVAARPRDSKEVLPALTYRFLGIARNDPIGPTPVAPEPLPLPPPPPPEPLYTWYDLYPIPMWFVLEDPYADPWNGL